MRLKVRITVLALAIALISMSAPSHIESASAADRTHENTVVMTDLDQAEVDLKKLFNEHLTQDSSGTWLVNEQAAIRDGISLADLNTISHALNSPLPEEAPSAEHAIGSTEWARCTINYAGFGALFELLSSDALSDLKAKRFERPARAIIRILGRAAIRGGVAGLVASLAAGTIWCSTPWAS